MVINDNLVKLASFDAAGISILAIFIVGVIILKLPNNVTKEKVSILKFFIKSCFVFVIVSALSGFANAAFNKDKIDQKQAEINSVTYDYNQDRSKWKSLNDSLKSSNKALLNKLNEINITNDHAQPNFHLDRMNANP